MCSRSDDPSQTERMFSDEHLNAAAGLRPAAPWPCNRCGLVNWPRFKTGLPRLQCHGCGEPAPTYHDLVAGPPGYGGVVSEP